MTRLPVIAVAALGIAGAATAAEIAPNDVEFVDGAVEASLTGVPGDPAAGVAVMERDGGNCIACHSVSALPDVPFHGEVGPLLDGAANRWTEAQLRGIVTNAKMMFDGTMMPSFYKSTGYIRPGDAFTGKAAADPDNLPPLLTAQQVEDVVAFLMTLTEE